MKKRILAALVCAMMALSLAGCEKNEGGDDTSSRTNTTSSTGGNTPGGNGGADINDPGSSDSSNENGNSDDPGSSSENSSAEESKPSEPEKYPEATNVLYLQGEKLDFPETPATDFDYGIKNDQLYITEYFGKNPDVHIPETIDGKKVAGLLVFGSGYFNDYGKIKRLIVPDNVALNGGFENLESMTFLGAVNLPSDFYCGKLTNVFFDGDTPNATQISRLDSPWFVSIKEHDGLCVLKDTLVFGARCSGDVVVPEGVTKIMDYAFNADASTSGLFKYWFDKAKLNSVTLPDGLKEIGASAFYDTGLTSVNIPDSVSEIGAGAFYKTPYYNNMPSPAGMKIDRTWLFYSSVLGHVVVPDGIKHIADGAFQNAKMQSLTLPDGLVSIGDKAFSGASFKDITLPDSVTDIGVLTFENSSLFSLDKYKDSKGVVVFGQVAVIDNRNDGNYVVPDGVKKVSFMNTYRNGSGDYGCYNVTITLPDSFDTYVTNIQNYCNTIIYKGNTYNISSNSSLDWIAERDAFKAAVEGN